MGIFIYGKKLSYADVVKGKKSLLMREMEEEASRLKYLKDLICIGIYKREIILYYTYDTYIDLITSFKLKYRYLCSQTCQNHVAFFEDIDWDRAILQDYDWM